MLLRIKPGSNQKKKKSNQTYPLALTYPLLLSHNNLTPFFSLAHTINSKRGVY